MIIRNSNIKIQEIVPSGEQLKGNQKTEQLLSFDKILSQKLSQTDDIKFSKHARQRLETRNIELTGQQKERINDGIKKAQAKGINDSLVLCDNLAFLVSVKNKTVVTALNGNELKNNVFTNIDGAVIV